MLFLAYASFPSAGSLSSACGHRSPNYLFISSKDKVGGPCTDLLGVLALGSPLPHSGSLLSFLSAVFWGHHWASCP